MNAPLSIQVEALIFASTQPLSVEDICSVILQLQPEADLDLEKTRSIVKELQEKYEGAEFAFQLKEINQGFQFFTKKEFHPLIDLLVIQRSKKRLSQSALETLSIIAYKQPVTKVEIEEIRGVNSDYSIQRLLEKDLIKIMGKAHSPGRPILYGVSDSFMDYFGLNSLADLPKLKDIVSKDNVIGDSTL